MADEHLWGLTYDRVRTFLDWRDPEFLELFVRARFSDGVISAVTNGCFDLFHLGHANLLRQIDAYREPEYNRPVFLVALVNSDESVRRLKGSRRPYYPLAARMSMLTVHPVVRAVAGFAEDTPADALAVLAPHLLFKGEEYTGTEVPGQQSCGRVVFLKTTPGYRTTDLENRIADPRYQESS
jgi:D-beta-D-heptose 7-phosphate kinase / D-beta-D-heptose 1-phosphate adenosyltransferase